MSPSPQAFRPYWALLPLMGLYLASLVQLFAIQGFDTKEQRKDRNDTKTREVTLSAPRGALLDRNGHVLAEDRAIVDLVMNFEKKHRGLWKNFNEGVLSQEEVAERLAFLAEATEVPLDRLEEVLMEGDGAWVLLRRGVGPADERRIRAAMSRIPGSGLSLIPRYERVFPDGTALAHVIGLPNQVNEKGESVSPGSGMERALRERLVGTEGQRNARAVGRSFGVNPALDMLAPVPGEDVLTTFDVSLAAFTREQLWRMKESKPMTNCMAIVVDVNSGEVLVASGLPDYNPNDPDATITTVVNPVSGIEEHSGWVFPARWYVEPGSTFKPIMAAYALDRGAILPTTTFENMGQRYLPPGRARKDPITNAIGVHDIPMTFREGIIQSSNIVYAQIARAVGRQGMADMLDALKYRTETFRIRGLGTTFSPRFEPERKYFFQERSPNGMAYTIPNMGYGHGFQVSPIDHAMTLAAIANGGELLEPTVLMEDPVLSRGRIFSEKSTALVREAMHAQSMYKGRDRYLKHRDLMSMASKSGTAQIDYGPDKGKYYSLFTAFGPYEDPQVLVLVIATGTVAIPHSGDGHFGIRVCGEAADAILYRALLERGLAQGEPAEEGSWIDASAPLDGRPAADRLGVGNR